VTPVADADLRELLRDNLLFGRKIDRGNPNLGNLGSDFNRFGLAFWSLVDVHHPRNPARKAALEELNGWRNAIAHQDFLASMLRGGRPEWDVNTGNIANFPLLIEVLEKHFQVRIDNQLPQRGWPGSAGG
jgi:hypothetical protein